MISMKNSKRTLSLYAVVVPKANKAVIDIKGFRITRKNTDTVSEIPVMAHEVTVNHTSGVLSFWLSASNGSADKYERVQSFARDNWIRYYKVMDYPGGYPPKA